MCYQLFPRFKHAVRDLRAREDGSEQGEAGKARLKEIPRSTIH